jgi:hypothetical protein
MSSRLLRKIRVESHVILFGNYFNVLIAWHEDEENPIASEF